MCSSFTMGTYGTLVQVAEITDFNANILVYIRIKVKVKNKIYSKKDLENICKNSESFREVALKLGYSPNHGGEVINKIKNELKKYKINTSHFKGRAHTKNKGKTKTPLKEYLSNNIKITSYNLKNKLINENIFDKKCNSCGLTHWLNKPIPLELHHKDGNKFNNNLSNLELLCPNCHAFTNTYRTKNIGAYKNESFV